MPGNTLYNESLLKAKTGYTILAGETTLHSRYNPVLEAEKYIDSLSLMPYKYFILLEPGLGYLAAALKKRFPASQVISLHCSSFYNKNNSILKNIDHNWILNWDPLTPDSLEDFLEITLSDADASDIKLIEWQPSVNIYGETVLDLTSRTVECIRLISAGRKTARNFGKRWFKNALHNLPLLHTTVSAFPGSAQILVCAAGPSLEEHLDEIAGWNRDNSQLLIVAVSSAAPALLSRNIIPNIIITTDGGGWARYHMTESLRNHGTSLNEMPVIASALTAILPSQVKDHPVLILHDGSLWQKILLDAAGFCCFTSPQRGTVSISALDLAFYLTSGEIFICGLDFAHRDILTHARPYVFQNFMEQKQYRLTPFYSQLFERDEMIRGGGSHDIYASWLTSHLDSFSGRLYSLGESKYGIPLGKPALKKGKKNRFTIQNNNRKTGKNYFIDILSDALNNPRMEKQLEKELGELLLPDIPNTDTGFTGELKKALLEFANG